MRRIIDIIDDAKDGKIPDHEECFWTMLALYHKLHFVYRDLEKIGEAFENGKATGIAVALRAKSEESVFADRFNFHRLDPVKFNGNTGNPFLEETQKFRNMALEILENATKNNQ